MTRQHSDIPQDLHEVASRLDALASDAPVGHGGPHLCDLGP